VSDPSPPVRPLPRPHIALLPPSAPAERRLFRRFPSGLAARRTSPAGTWNCSICDLSLGGAGLEPALPTALGREVALVSPGLPLEQPLTGRVVACSRHGTHVAFHLDPDAEEALVGYLQGG
jgi:hypothetical protein